MNRSEDHFSRQAPLYARHRPRYPAGLFAYLAAAAPGHRLAWDCGTGSGQAAVGLAEHFEQVVATDLSAEQIAHAMPHPRIRYVIAPADRVETAQTMGLEPQSVDLVTAAQALHWFDLDRFYAEVRRVLRPGGLLAVSEELIEPEYVPLAVTERWCRRAGFEQIEAHRTFWFYTLVARNPPHAKPSDPG
jgi:ubiquinone/menaquinone biosynthesis C-methylase UbiE